MLVWDLALVRTDVWEKRVASMTKVTRIDELGISLAATAFANVVPSSLILSTVTIEVTCCYET
jgi:hypothetical protein